MSTFWETAKWASEEVKKWPEWKRSGFVAATRGRTDEQELLKELHAKEDQLYSEVPEVWHEILGAYVASEMPYYEYDTDIEFRKKRIETLRSAVLKFNAAIEETLRSEIKNQII